VIGAYSYERVWGSTMNCGSGLFAVEFPGKVSQLKHVASP